jgi:hypothetical protein
MKPVIRLLLLFTLLVQFPAIARADEVTEWNKIMLETQRAAGIGGIVAIRHSAIISSAVFDAVNGIERRFTSIHVQPDAAPGASVRAAAIQAAYASLVQTVPAGLKPGLDAKREASLAAIASESAAEHSQSIARGIEWGQTVADAIVAWRNADGFTPPPPPYNGGLAIGQWRPTPTAFAPFAAVQLGFTTPWVIPSPLAFPLSGPPGLTSAQYTTDFNEVKLLGSIGSIARTADQTLAARFWAATNSPNYSWNTVAVNLGEARHTTLSENSRLLALMNVAIADTGITVWRWKRVYDFWRPITAIQLAASDGNPFTDPDPAWTPLIVNPPYPDYPSGINGAAAAALTVLSDFFGENTSFSVDSDAPTMAGIVRNFPNFDAAKTEMVDTRIHSGIHFRFADQDSRVLGTTIANYVIANALQPLHGQKKGQLK